MTFDAVMTNPKPPGEIVTSGRFGPWNRESPGRTPVYGTVKKPELGLAVGGGRKAEPQQ